MSAVLSFLENNAAIGGILGGLLGIIIILAGSLRRADRRATRAEIERDIESTKVEKHVTNIKHLERLNDQYATTVAEARKRVAKYASETAAMVEEPPTTQELKRAEAERLLEEAKDDRK